MSKKPIIIGSICLALITAGGSIWFISGKQNPAESISASQETLNSTEQSSTLPQNDKYDISSSEAAPLTEAELVVSTIAEKVKTTESVCIAKAEAKNSSETITSSVSVLLTKADTTQKNADKKNPPISEPSSSKTDPVPDKNTDNTIAETPEPAKKVETPKPATGKPESDTQTSSEPTRKATSSQSSGNQSTTRTEPPTRNTETPTESPPEPPTTVATERPTEKPTETVEEKPKCSHTWVWKTHTETKTIPAKTHDVPVYDDGWDEAVTVRKIYCSSCQSIYENLDDYYEHDFCFGSFGHITVIDHYIHHEPELLYYDTITDEPAHEETVTVNDYEYCSKCGERK